MNAIVLLLSLVASFSSFACIDIGKELKICPNDVVFKGDDYIEGARVVAVNPRRQKVTVKSISSGILHVVAPDDLDITRGCTLGICVGDKVFKGDYYIEGARVVAVNPRRQKVTVKSISSGRLHVEAPDDLDIIDRCLEFDFER